MNNSKLEASFMTLWHLLNAVHEGNGDVPKLVWRYGYAVQMAITLGYVRFDMNGVLTMTSEGNEELETFGDHND